MSAKSIRESATADDFEPAPVSLAECFHLMDTMEVELNAARDLAHSMGLAVAGIKDSPTLDALARLVIDMEAHAAAVERLRQTVWISLHPSRLKTEAKKARPDQDSEDSEAQLDEELNKERQEQVDAFNALYSEWLDVMAAVHRPSEPMDDEALDARSDRADAAARLVCATPAVLPYQVRYKIDVLDHALRDGDRWADHREIAMLGGIKADLAGFCS
jgi:hypothetical protein